MRVRFMYNEYMRGGGHLYMYVGVFRGGVIYGF